MKRGTRRRVPGEAVRRRHHGPLVRGKVRRRHRVHARERVGRTHHRPVRGIAVRAARDHAPVRALGAPRPPPGMRRVPVPEQKRRARRGEPRGVGVARVPRVVRERVRPHGRCHGRDRRRRHRRGGRASVRDGRWPGVPSGGRLPAPCGGYRVRVAPSRVVGPSVRAVAPGPPRGTSQRVELVVPALLAVPDARTRPQRLRAPLAPLAPRHLEHLRRVEGLARGFVRVQALVAAQAVHVDDSVVRAEADQPPREVVVPVREREVQRGLPRVRLLVHHVARRRVAREVGALQHELSGFALVVLRRDVQERQAVRVARVRVHAPGKQRVQLFRAPVPRARERLHQILAAAGRVRARRQRRAGRRSRRRSGRFALSRRRLIHEQRRRPPRGVREPGDRPDGLARVRSRAPVASARAVSESRALLLRLG